MRVSARKKAAHCADGRAVDACDLLTPAQRSRLREAETAHSQRVPWPDSLSESLSGHAFPMPSCDCRGPSRTARLWKILSSIAWWHCSCGLSFHEYVCKSACSNAKLVSLLNGVAVLLALRLWSHRLRRVAAAKEHLVIQGVPILEHLESASSRLPGKSWSAFVARSGEDGDMFRSLSGNSMHRAVLGTWAAYILSSLQPRIMWRRMMSACVVQRTAFLQSFFLQFSGGPHPPAPGPRGMSLTAMRILTDPHLVQQSDGDRKLL